MTTFIDNRKASAKTYQNFLDLEELSTNAQENHVQSLKHACALTISTLKKNINENKWRVDFKQDYDDVIQVASLIYYSNIDGSIKSFLHELYIELESNSLIKRTSKLENMSLYSEFCENKALGLIKYQTMSRTHRSRYLNNQQKKEDKVNNRSQLLFSC